MVRFASPFFKSLFNIPLLADFFVMIFCKTRKRKHRLFEEYTQRALTKRSENKPKERKTEML
jgi:hypothetical protein